MQRLTLTIPVASFAPGDSFHVYGNVDADGMPAAAVDYDRPITGDTAWLFWRLTEIPPGHLEGDWLQTDWLGRPAQTPDDHEVQTPLLYFGWYEFAVKTFDQAGNASSGEPDVMRVFCNSGPEPPRRFRQTDSVDGRPVFGFTAPAQLAA